MSAPIPERGGAPVRAGASAPTSETPPARRPWPRRPAADVEKAPAGAIPDAPTPASPGPHPLVVEAMKKAAVAWVAPAGHPSTLAWLLWLDDDGSGAAYVVHDGPEQWIPGLHTASTCTVTARGDSGGRIVSWPAEVTHIEPGSAEWDAVVPQLVQKRLNLSAQDEVAGRWAEEVTVSRLRPAGDPVEHGGTLPADSQAAPPRETPVTTPTRIPRTFGPRPRRRR